ncbi:MAG: MATE family efflux transporter [Chitinophagales bacterium]
MAVIAPKNTLTHEIRTQSIWKLMIRLSAPAIIGMSVNGINAFVDAIFVGQFIGKEAVAAISLAFPLTMITNGFSAMIGVGASSLLSIAIGSDDETTQKKIFGTLTALSVIVSTVLSLLGIYFARDLIAFLGGKGEILEMGTLYYRITMIGAFFRIYAVAINMLIRAEGKIKEAMALSIVSTLLNMVLDPLFIIVFAWGIAGAAWATVAAMGVFTILGVLYFVRGHASYPISLTTFSLEKKLLRPILSIGTSAMMLQVMFFVQQAVVFKSLAYYGTDWDLAFMGSCYRIFLLVILPTMGFAQAMQPILGINFGAKDFQRVKQTFNVFAGSGTVFVLFLWAFILLFPEMILGWMLPDATLTPNDVFNFRIMLSTLPVLPIFLIGTTFFQSIGNAKSAGIVLISREVLLYIPFTLALPLWFGVDGIYYAGVPVNLIVIGVVVWMIWREFGKWARVEALKTE